MSEVFQHSDSSILHIPKWKNYDSRLEVGFTTREGGVSKAPFATFNHGLHVSDRYEDVITNRKRLAEKLGILLDHWISGEQVHQTDVREVYEQDKGKGSRSTKHALSGVDGMITNKAGLLCTAFFADCVPLYFFDPETNYVGIAHAGWKGTVNRMAEQMIKKLQSVGSKPKNILVVIGPCISQKHYEVDEKVIQHIPMDVRNKVSIEKGNNRYLLDLKELNKHILLQCGVLRNNIDITNYCTYQHEQLFFSHRRDQGQTGRMLGYVGFRNE
ncbi:peptidoglycan editing factor PgeF [Oceanobacillus halotolerans]|uniref:peptidoglycan editing factor PgeF n=1 Tax=Oceanobacillus halotolerans TaxID=2663380 RepID=UPI0013D9FE13|nr:peptidoglycan editing factor PgeF [Oceanobacillus halotolerans]